MFTTLKALKWAHDLGVKQERQRIARFLEGQASHLGSEFSVEHDMLRQMPDSAKQRKSRLEVKHAATQRVQEIVGSVLNPHYEDRPMASFMFPEEEK